MTSIRVGDASPQEIKNWLDEFFASIDRMDAAAFAAHFRDVEGSFRFANQAPIRGREDIARAAAGIFGLLRQIRHDLIRHWASAGDVLVEGIVHYHRAGDGLHLSFPFMSVFEFSPEGFIHSYRVFVDSHELFQPPATGD